MTSLLHRLAPPPIPTWTAVLILGASSTGLALVAAYLGGAGGLIAAFGGYTFGALAAASGPLRAFYWHIGAGLAAVAVAGFFADPLASAACLVTLTFLASQEFAKAGTRCLIGAVFGFLAFEVGLAKSTAHIACGVFVLGVAAGLLATKAAGLGAIIPKSPATREHGTFMFLFLTIGILCSAVASHILNEPRGYWIALIFAMRGLVPLERQGPAVLRYGAFAVIGVAVSVGLQLIGIPLVVRLLVCLGLVVLGTKYIAHPIPVSASAFTAAIVLASATTMQDAVYRIEAIAIVVCLVLILAFGLEWHWKMRQRWGGSKP
ncbi:MAG: hypothetical protein AAFO72_06730 [Pseudomonadota bacterium]